ncbi:DUF2161 family putative PD-(D/E)XK-type phosphodiesterase [Acidaminobacter sp. JC074]|uniref:DUF2161 family putative PD-(D/E)XK-type phosphodiesterase n=1 Tax=Acidaminobacter sp. JC074 TaxID=2530199 RepID=UPI001F0EF408|nr:DUF2161 family putative PD-(D/E)XK-type phosphodiesterase [Acidaminobacter sp. JC074]
MKDLKESDLYHPIKKYFESCGYKVHGEVKDIDMVIKKDDESIAIELKPTFNLKLILQAVDRQKTFDSVYVAIFKPKQINKRYKEVVHLIKRLELGLITVSVLKSGMRVTIENHPLAYNRKKNHKKKRAIISEIDRRTGIVENIGGTTGIKRMTAYREETIAVAVALSKYQEASPKQVKLFTDNKKTGQILYSNHYGWFDRIGQGKYRLTAKGFEALETYKEVADYFRNSYSERTVNEVKQGK